MLQKWRLGCEALAGGQLGLEGRAQQVEDEIDARTLLVDVVLEIGVQPLVAQVELRREADEQDISVEGCQVEQASQFIEAQSDPGAQAVRLFFGDTGRDPIKRRAHIRQCRRARFGGPTRQPGRLGQQCVDLLLGDIQALEFVGRALHFPRAVDCRLDQQVDALQFGKDVMKRIRKALHACCHSRREMAQKDSTNLASICDCEERIAQAEAKACVHARTMQPTAAHNTTAFCKSQ